MIMKYDLLMSVLPSFLLAGGLLAVLIGLTVGSVLHPRPAEREGSVLRAAWYSAVNTAIIMSAVAVLVAILMGAIR